MASEYENPFIDQEYDIEYAPGPHEPGCSCVGCAHALAEAFKAGADDAPYDGPFLMNANVNEGADAAGSSSTAYSIDVGDTFAGTISSTSDVDWVAIDLTAGEDYTFHVWGTGGVTSGIQNSLLGVFDSSSNLEVANDDLFPPGNLFSGVEFTPTTSGTYYVAIAGDSQQNSNENTFGTYEFQATTNIWTPQEVAKWMTTTNWGVPVELRFNVSPGDTLTVDVTALSNGTAMALTALNAWSAVTGINFQQVNGNAQITFSENVSGVTAFAGPTSASISSGIINTSQVTVSNGWLTQFGTGIDSYSFQTYIHEIGHAMGLAHTGPYDGNANYGTDDFYINDSVQMSIMSYFDETNTYTGMSDVDVITPMIADIIAMENLYGSFNAYTGDTTWGANSNVGGYLGLVFDRYFDGGAPQAGYAGGPVAFTVQDDGGHDHLDFSTATVDQVIDIRQGGVSDINGETGNVVVAIGSIIEDASSGSGDDNITGNSADNELRSGTGADTVRGGSGDDRIYAEGANSVLIGGSGDDFLRNDVGQSHFSGGSGDDMIAYFRRDSAVSVNLETGANNTGSTYSSIEGVIGTADYADTLVGDDDDNSLLGGGGNDRITGGRGNDSMNGGGDDDRLTDISGADTFNGGSGNDTASYFGHLSGVSVNLETGSNSSGDTYISIENLMGSNNASDTLRGDDDDNRLRGFAEDDRIFGGRGNDTLEGGAGDDYLRDESGADVFIGGSGDDTVSYYGRSSDLTASLGSGSNNSGDTYQSIESLIGSNGGNDLLIGSTSSNRLWGFDGDDTIRGGGGNDRIEGGDGDDDLSGNSGVDRFVFERNDDDDRILDFQNGTDIIVFDINGLDFNDLDIDNVSGGARIRYDPGDEILVLGISKSQLTNSDFEFV